MSQPRVTDFFVQRKKSDLSRASRAKGQKSDNNGALAVDTATLAVRPKTRQNRSKNIIAVKNTVKSTRSDKAVEEEFLRVIDEATSVKVGSEPASLIRSDSETLTLYESPKTPKRTCADAEFDLGSAVFSTTADHSTAKKKRLQVESSVTVKVVDKTSVKTARKKLILSKATEQQDVEQGVLQLPQNLPQSVDNDSKTTTTKNRNQSTANKSPTGNEALSKDAVTTLKARLQKIKAQAEKLSSSPSPAPEAVATAPGLQAKLARARQLAARAEQRKVWATEDQAQPPAEEEEKQPSYQRYHTLAQDIPPGLSLPYHYKLLADTFRSMDTITGMLFNRSETVTFAKLKQGVEDMTRRRFEETHVGQIKTVYPSAYTFRQERNIPTFSSTLKKSSYQLTLEPVLEDSEGTGKQETRPTLSASLQLERRRIFHKSLVNMVKEHHMVFLSSLNPPVTVPDDMLTRWHPRFNVDQVPQPQPSFLPQPPQTEKLTTAQEVLDKARSIMTPKMEKALANMALKTAETARAKELECVPPQPDTIPKSALGPNPVETPSALKGVSQSLLERIRTKEAQKLQVAMTRNPLQEERLLMLSRLCELARILRNVFVAEKKPALIMELTCNRMVSSYRSALSTGEMEKHLRLLAELTPEWLVIHKIRKHFYLKLNKTMDLSMVLQKLNHKMKEI
ncbi:DNA replication factor Cdt1 [Osmerus eperlanus]|uniref:DNA replication factor Cdt1 n=1 Tax=Osmerus eperlanus TaxID=29151 RepID=UPI002E0E8CC3